MSEIHYSHASSTLSYVMAGLFSMHFLNAHPERPALAAGAIPISQDSYLASGSGATFDTYRGSVTGRYDHTSLKFEQAVEIFYASLLVGKQPLGSEFEKVLYDNLWNLYES